MPRGPYDDWTTEALLEYEEALYDEEVAGGDTWAERDQVLWELNRRKAGAVGQSTPD